LKIIFLSVGRIKKGYAKDGVAEYLKRINRYMPVEEVVVKDESSGGKVPRVDVLKREGERLLGKLKQGDIIIALDEQGRGFSSAAFAKQMERFLGSGKKRLCFIVGGAFGLSEELKKKADLLLALSEMTMPHDLARLVLSEQVYRAFTIMRGEPYSH
jgi:23S rRNA (pseudouridine1915-N3)-methyltransferase